MIVLFCPLLFMKTHLLQIKQDSVHPIYKYESIKCKNVVEIKDGSHFNGI